MMSFSPERLLAEQHHFKYPALILLLMYKNWEKLMSEAAQFCLVHGLCLKIFNDYSVLRFFKVVDDASRKISCSPCC